MPLPAQNIQTLSAGPYSSTQDHSISPNICSWVTVGRTLVVFAYLCSTRHGPVSRVFWTYKNQLYLSCSGRALKMLLAPLYLSMTCYSMLGIPVVNDGLWIDLAAQEAPSSSMFLMSVLLEYNSLHLNFALIFLFWNRKHWMIKLLFVFRWVSP